MIQTDFAFGFFKDGFDRPTHAADAYELAQRCIGGSIAEVVFDHRRVIQIAADDQPEFACGQVAARLGHAQEGKFTNDRPFTAFFDNGLNPIFFGNVPHQFLHLNWTVARIAQTQAGWTTTTPFPLGNMHFGLGAPDGGGILDLGEIPLAQIGNSIPKSGGIPVQRIRRHPLEGQTCRVFRLFAAIPAQFLAWSCRPSLLARHTHLRRSACSSSNHSSGMNN